MEDISRYDIFAQQTVGYFDESDIDIISVKGISKEKGQTAPVGEFKWPSVDLPDRAGKPISALHKTIIRRIEGHEKQTL
jgi:hypothetical protein